MVTWINNYSLGASGGHTLFMCVVPRFLSRDESLVDLTFASESELEGAKGVIDCGTSYRT